MNPDREKGSDRWLCHFGRFPQVFFIILPFLSPISIFKELNNVQETIFILKVPRIVQWKYNLHLGSRNLFRNYGFWWFFGIFCDFWPFLSTYEPEMISNARTGLLKQSFQHLTPFNPLKSPKKSFIDEKSDGLTRNSGLRGQILVFRSFLASNFPKMYIFEKFLRILFFYIK